MRTALTILLRAGDMAEIPLHNLSRLLVLILLYFSIFVLVYEKKRETNHNSRLL